ncbi:MAG: S9 family peptidase, partial [Candidatus Aminicenantes bacterium]|nr:S9 family peptidase [Candidatus Aminicenantes bacterium]
MKQISGLLLLVGLCLNLNAGPRAIQFEDMFQAGRLSHLTVSPDGKWIAFAVKTPDLKNNSYHTDVYALSIENKEIKKLTDSEANYYAPRFISRDMISLVSTRTGSPQLYVLSVSEPDKIKQVMAKEITGGIGQYLWQPGARTLAFQKDIFPESESIEKSYEKEKQIEESGINVKVLTSLMYRVWNQWRDGKRSHVFLYDTFQKTIVDLTPGDFDTPPLDLGGKQDFVFSPDGKWFAYVKNTDPMVAISTNNDIFLKQLHSQEEQNITVENKGNDMNPVFSPTGKHIAYLSMNRAGFEADKKNIILYDLKRKTRKNLTGDFKFNVNEIVFSNKGKKIYFSVTESVYHPIYRLNIKSGKIHKLVHGVYSSDLNITPDDKFLIFFNQTVSFPREVFRLDIRRKKVDQLSYFNKKVFENVAMKDIELFRYQGADDEEVEGILLKPPFFDPHKKYPLVFLIHGGPQGAWGDDFHFRWNLSMFASPGYVVVAINFHGSRGYGQPFTDSVSGAWGGAPFVDLVKGQEYAVKKFDFIDKDKIVAAGASYGGFMISWIAGHHDRFKYPFSCLVTHDGIFDSRSMYYSTEELWFEEWEHGGTPWTSELFEKYNPAGAVDKFSIPMLIIHGEKDFRVPVSQGLMLFTALQRRGVKSKMLYFPDEDHFVQKPKNARFWWESVLGW